MSRPLPARPDLDWDKKQAKALLRAHQSGDPDAVRRFRQFHPRLAALTDTQVQASPLRLSDAQLVIAREYGFASWRALKTHVEAVTRTFDQNAGALVDAALNGDLPRVRDLLALQPELAAANAATAAVLGDAAALSVLLADDPGTARREVGFRGWQPLLYACFSRLSRREPERRPGILECARLLLAAGADPNAFFVEPAWPDGRQTCLYGATGVNDQPELATLLLSAGADPSDGEALYHGAELDDLTCLRLLCEAGAKLRGTNVLNRKLDFVDPEGVRLLLEHGADPNEYTPNALHHALVRGRGLAEAELLVQFGVDVSGRDRCGRTAYQVAVRLGNAPVADLLLRHGADPSLTLADRFVGACARVDETEARSILAEHPDLVSKLMIPDLRQLPEMVAVGRRDAVRLMLELGFPVDTRGAWDGSALHHAAYWGDAEAVELLLQYGPRLETVNAYGGTPLGAALFGSTGCHRPHGGNVTWGFPEDVRHGDYPRAVELLLEAGAALPERASGSREVREVLRMYGVE